MSFVLVALFALFVLFVIAVGIHADATSPAPAVLGLVLASAAILVATASSIEAWENRSPAQVRELGQVQTVSFDGYYSLVTTDQGFYKVPTRVFARRGDLATLEIFRFYQDNRFCVSGACYPAGPR